VRSCEDDGVSLAPKTEFVLRGDAHLAYQVFGEGPTNVLNVNGYATHREQMWQFPFAIRGLEWAGRFARVAGYDTRDRPVEMHYAPAVTHRHRGRP
jgi:hypothetical protein